MVKQRDGVRRSATNAQTAYKFVEANVTLQAQAERRGSERSHPKTLPCEGFLRLDAGAIFPPLPEGQGHPNGDM
ncbi:hypothetical protein KSF_111470 [Reticulibacter mediterranei]|uniref:Uncharacterized protein n=1 Tax=Reticulibacter mediterranei TaxID=2778369 RepID=A0A8J3IS87_9CHLR|nr:hypothetical protein KSF_111470 [Reticulibacter mediterranei]